MVPNIGIKPILTVTNLPMASDLKGLYSFTLNNISTPSNNVSVSNSNNIITVTANTTTSSFTILCQFTMTSNNTIFNVRVLIEP